MRTNNNNNNPKNRRGFASYTYFTRRATSFEQQEKQDRPLAVDDSLRQHKVIWMKKSLTNRSTKDGLISVNYCNSTIENITTLQTSNKKNCHMDTSSKIQVETRSTDDTVPTASFSKEEALEEIESLAYILDDNNENDEDNDDGADDVSSLFQNLSLDSLDVDGQFDKNANTIIPTETMGGDDDLSSTFLALEADSDNISERKSKEDQLLIDSLSDQPSLLGDTKNISEGLHLRIRSSIEPALSTLKQETKAYTTNRSRSLGSIDLSKLAVRLNRQTLQQSTAEEILTKLLIDEYRFYSTDFAGIRASSHCSSREHDHETIRNPLKTALSAIYEEDASCACSNDANSNIPACRLSLISNLFIRQENIIKDKFSRIIPSVPKVKLSKIHLKALQQKIRKTKFKGTFQVDAEKMVQHKLQTSHQSTSLPISQKVFVDEGDNHEFEVSVHRLTNAAIETVESAVETLSSSRAPTDSVEVTVLEGNLLCLTATGMKEQHSLHLQQGEPISSKVLKPSLLRRLPLKMFS